MPDLDRIGLAKPPVRGDLAGIQYVRGAAALMVVADHVSTIMSEPKYYGSHPLGGIFEAGAVGVDIFFCLSGFIIVYIALTETLAPKLAPVDFFRRRFARIIPFMWLVVIVYAGLRAFARGAFPYADYLRALTLCPIGDLAPPQIWTLRHEALFYIIFAVSFLSRRRWPFLLWVLSPLAGYFLMPGAAASPNFWPALAGFFFNNVNLLFGFGTAIGIFYVKSGHFWKLQKWAAPVLALGLLAVFGAANCINYNRGSIPEVVLIGLLSCVSLLLACIVLPSSSVLGRLGKTLGDASYCIYLTHPAFVSAMLGIFAWHFHRLPDAIVLGATFTIAVILGVIVNKLVEDPLVAWSKSLLIKRPARRPLPARLG